MTDEASGRAFRGRSLALSTALWAGALASFIRLGVVDHQWVGAAVLAAVLVVAIPVVLRVLRWRDASLKEAPHALFAAGGASIVVSSLRDQPRFRDLVHPWHGQWVFGGWASGELVIDRAGVRFRPGRVFGRGISSIDVTWPEVASVRTVPLPAKINVANLAITFHDGSRLEMQVRGRDRLDRALARLRTDGLVE